MESELVMQCWSSASSRDPFLAVHCQGGSVAANAVTSSILCLVAPTRGVVICGSHDRHSHPLNWGIVTSRLQFGKVWGSDPLFGVSDACKHLPPLPRSGIFLFCFLHYIVETQACFDALSAKREILSGRQPWFPFHHSLKPVTAGLLSLLWGRLAKKDAGFCRAPGAMLTCSLPAPREGGGCLSHGL